MGSLSSSIDQGFAPLVVVKSALKDIQTNYKAIEKEIEKTTNIQRSEHQSRYSKVMEQLESLKQSLKTEVSNRKQTEDQFMQIVDVKTQSIQTEHTVKFLNQMYQMK